MILTSNQMSNLDSTISDLQSKKVILDTAVDVQALLQLLVELEVIRREDMAVWRKRVKNNDPKYRDTYTYIDNALEEAMMYKANPQQMLKDMLDMKMKGK